MSSRCVRCLILWLSMCCSIVLSDKSSSASASSCLISCSPISSRIVTILAGLRGLGSALTLAFLTLALALARVRFTGGRASGTSGRTAGRTSHNTSDGTLPLHTYHLIFRTIFRHICCHNLRHNLRHTCFFDWHEGNHLSHLKAGEIFRVVLRTL